MKLAHSACSFAIVVTLMVIPGSLVYGQSGGDALADLDPAWVDSWKYEIDKQVDMFSSAYGMNEDEAATFRTELENRILVQKEYEDRMNAELQAIQKEITDAGIQPEDEDAPLNQKLTRRFMELTAGMPLVEGQTAAWLAARMPPDAVKEGQARFEELMEKKTREQIVGRFDLELAAGRKAGFSKEVLAMKAPIDPAYNRPVPTSDLGERVEAMDRLARVARNIEPTRGRPTNTEALPNNGVPQYVAPPVTRQIPQQPVVPADTKPATPALPGPPRPVVSNPGADVSRAAPHNAKPEPPPQPAPPLDDWEKYVLSTADKYGFNDAQLTNARSILSDLRRRAYQYQASRAEAFARAELMTEAKAREAEKKALNRPLDALFAELKVRLDSLPTQAQRQKAGPTPAKR